MKNYLRVLAIAYIVLFCLGLSGCTDHKTRELRKNAFLECLDKTLQSKEGQPEKDQAGIITACRRATGML